MIESYTTFTGIANDHETNPSPALVTGKITPPALCVWHIFKPKHIG